MRRPIEPGATLGVLGSGQLGRMFAIAARRLGYRVHVYSPEYDTPTGQVADLEVKAAYEDLEEVARFARGVAVLTFEFENVPAACAETAARHTEVRPAPGVLFTTQNRLREKSWLRAHGVPVAPFRAVRTQADLEDAVRALRPPLVLKTAALGYDGKGQAVIARAEEAIPAWERLGRSECVLEAFVAFAAELSVIAARGLDGRLALYGPLLNTHREHILDTSTAPAALPAAVAEGARDIARSIMEGLEVVGVLCVEYFLQPDGGLLVNELAPRPHNSGHLTIDACVTCQFEQQVRAVSGLPLGSPELLRPAAMANLLGELWEGGEPDWARACADPWVKLHLYGKAEARPGRKMGHLTALAETAEEALRRVLSARAALSGERRGLPERALSA